jgi:haloalkane dehalogenase
MDRRTFLNAAVALPTALAVAGEPPPAGPIAQREFQAMRRFVRLPMGRIAYLERGRGPAALFLHGLPLNSYQWRGALERLSGHRRCIAPDLMGFGHTEIVTGTDQRPQAQVEMLLALLDTLGERSVDLIGSDSGGALAQLFAARHSRRVRTLILTNCDAGTDCPPQVLIPSIADAHAGTATDKLIGSFLHDRDLARSSRGLGVAYTDPHFLTDELLDIYLQPLVQSPLRKQQFNQALIVLEHNFLLPLEPDLRRFPSPVRILWGTADTLFRPDNPDYLQHLLPNSRGVRRIEGARLFWPEEFPDILAEEARQLWDV